MMTVRKVEIKNFELNIPKEKITDEGFEYPSITFKFEGTEFTLPLRWHDLNRLALMEDRRNCSQIMLNRIADFEDDGDEQYAHDMKLLCVEHFDELFQYASRICHDSHDEEDDVEAAMDYVYRKYNKNRRSA